MIGVILFLLFYAYLVLTRITIYNIFVVPINSVRKFLLLNKIFEIQTRPIAKANWYFRVMIIKNNNYEMSVIIKIFFFLVSIKKQFSILGVH